MLPAFPVIPRIAGIWPCLMASVGLAAAPASGPATAPAPLTQPSILKITLRLPADPPTGEYRLRLPAGYGPGQRPALIICLHGTDDTAEQMLAFWSARTTPVPVILAAPQGHGKGWSESDLPTIRAMMADLHKYYPYDTGRVLLAGFSAGGAMTFELLYREGLPITAAAALANYVPPHIKAPEVAAHKNIPAFYAVGMSDINHELMRVGLEFLRTSGANVEIYRPRIGHTLDPDVAQVALDWFFAQCRRTLDQNLEQAKRETDPAAGAERVEPVVEQARWHEAVQVEQARQILDRWEEPGRKELQRAAVFRAENRLADAAELLEWVENTYVKGRLANEARRLREAIESSPDVAIELSSRRARARSDQAQRLLTAAQRALVRNNLSDATEHCRRIVEQYGDTPSAAKARHLLDMLQTSRTP